MSLRDLAEKLSEKVLKLELFLILGIVFPYSNVFYNLLSKMENKADRNKFKCFLRH